MKCTPQKTIVSPSAAAADAGEPERVADVVGDVLYLGHLVVVREDHRVALAASARTSSCSSAISCGESAGGAPAVGAIGAGAGEMLIAHLRRGAPAVPLEREEDHGETSRSRDNRGRAPSG